MFLSYTKDTPKVNLKQAIKATVQSSAPNPGSPCHHRYTIDGAVDVATVSKDHVHDFRACRSV